MEFLGASYSFVGILFLLIPILILELGRPKDFIRAGLFLVLGVYLLTKKSAFQNSLILFLILNTLLLGILVFDISLNRWNQLSETEKEKLKTFSELKKNLSKFFVALNIAKSKIFNFKMFDFKNNKVTKKWVRSEESARITTSDNDQLNSFSMPVKTKEVSQEDLTKGQQIK